MMTAVISLAVVAVVAIAAALVLWRLLTAERQRRHDAMQSHASEYARLASFALEKQDWLRDSLREQAARHKEEREAWTAQIEGLGHVVQGAMGTLTYGGTPEPAKITPLQPDAEARMQRRIKEDTIRAGTVSIKADYASAGMSISDEEARDQAIAFLNGDTVPVFGGG